MCNGQEMVISFSRSKLFIATDHIFQVIGGFTKFDVLFIRVYDRGIDKEKNREIALVTLEVNIPTDRVSTACQQCT